MDPATDDCPRAALRRWVGVVALLAAATLTAAAFDAGVSLASHAMVYLLAVVLAAYRYRWIESVVCAVGAVVALNFFFIPPRWTLSVEHHEHLIALGVMLTVALLTSQLAASVRRETAQARRSEARARQLQALAGALAEAGDESAVRAIGASALQAAFAGPCTLLLAGADGALRGDDPALTDHERDGLRCAIQEAAVLGPGTGRWPGLDAWFVPLGDRGRVVGAACVRQVLAADTEGREHAAALCALLAQAVWRLRLAASVQAAQAALQREQLQGSFLAAVSHDLRTPLAAIVGAATALQTQGDRLPAGERERLLGSIVGEAGYLSTLTENTLQLVRLAGTGIELRRDWESVEEIVGTVLARVRRRDPARRIGAQVPAALPLVQGDAVLLAQLLGNLLDNALRYSDGPVDVAVRCETGELWLCVKDRGPGLAGDGAAAGQPFARCDASGPHGAGLGLAVCRAIAQAHGGRLVLRQRGGGGTSACLVLPTEPQPAGAAP